MTRGHQGGRFYENEGYVKDLELEDAAPSTVETPPRQFLPRIGTLHNVGGRKPCEVCPVPEKNGSDGEMFTICEMLGLGSVEVPSEGDKDEENRDTWDNPREFLLSCISLSVGLGNIWRFPAAAAANGGGAFLIPYLVVLLLIGRPLYYLEMCLGQFSQYGQVKVWHMVPLFKGVGFGSLIVVISVCSYYCSLMAITVRFFVSSFANPVPWAECHPEKYPRVNCSDPDVKHSLAALYFSYIVNPQLPNIDDGLGKLNWQLLLCLIFSWVVIFLALVKGVKSSGKVAYFTAIFPYVVLLILFVRGVTLKGAWTGIKILLEPKWMEITKPKVWYSAVEQCFFSLNLGFGSIIMFSSYNSFRRNVYKDALIINFMDTFTSLLAGITVFAVIGNVMDARGVGIDQIHGVGGPGLAFILYPQAIATFNWVPPVFALLFFLMLFTLGIGSAASLTGSAITILCDQFPHWKRWLITLLVCTLGCVAGIMYVTEGGFMMLDLVDHYGVGKVVYIMVITECVAISYVYGLDNFCNDVQFMLGRRIGPYWRFCWGFFIPVGLTTNFIYYVVTVGEYKSNGVAYPTIATVFGWIWFAFGICMIPGWAIHAVVTRKAPSLKEKFCLALQPTEKWGPQGAKLREEWRLYRAKQAAVGRKRRFFIF